MNTMQREVYRISREALSAMFQEHGIDGACHAAWLEATAQDAHAGDDLAERVYNEYPRKVGKQAALKAIRAASKVMPYPALLEATKAYAMATASWPASERNYIPHPATWFNRGSYADDRSEWQRGDAKSHVRPVTQEERLKLGF
jgi:hypothetical protein